MTKTTLILVRHAEAEGNINRVFHGWTDGEITEIGHIQAKLLAERLKDTKIDVLYSSSLKRTMQTAEYISKVISLPIIRTDKMKEINGGDWEGVPWDELPERWPTEYDTWENKPYIHRMPKGESMEEFLNRLVKEVMHIISDNEGKNICIVTHGTAIRVLLCYFHLNELSDLTNTPWFDNTSITIVEYEDNKFNIIMEGDCTHLTSNLKTIENQKWWNDKKEKININKKNEG